MARDGPVLGLGGTFADQHVFGDMRPCLLPVAHPRNPQRASGPHAGGHLSLERTPALDIEGLVDRLMADPHRIIIREVDFEPVGDLLRAPRRHPPPVASVWFVAPFPRRSGLTDRLPLSGAH